MKILYVITQGEQGGAQLYVHTLAAASQGQNWSVYLAIGGKDENWLSREITALGGKFWPLDHLRRAPSPIHDVLAIFELAQLYHKIKPEVIHLNSSKAGILGSLASLFYRLRYPNTKIIYTAHGWVFNEPMSHWLKTTYYFLEKLTARFKTKIICVSEYDRQIGINSKVATADKLVTIHNGLDLPETYFLDRLAARKVLNANLTAAEFVIGTIANFYPTKGLKYLIGALKILVIDYQLPIKAAIIGDGKLRMELEQQIRDNNLQNNIILTGSIKSASKYLHAFDLAVMSSVKEGFPYFLLEAMAAGLPLVSTKVGGIPEIITDGHNGFLVEAQNEQSLAEKIKLIFDNKILADSMAQNNLQEVKEKFSQQQMIEATLACYK